MKHDNIDFHNVEELVKVPNKEGLRLQRYPESLRPFLNEGAKKMMMSPIANVEIRFLLFSDSVDITLSTEGDTTLRMYVFWSTFQERAFYEITNEPITITLKREDRYNRMDPKFIEESDYSYNLVRLMFMGNPDVQLYYHGIDSGEIGLPTKSDIPLKTLLSYGTSITHGAKLSSPHLTYPALTARYLGMDLINLGLSGAAHCEKELADYIANRRDFDIATLALSVNMYHSFSLEAFKARLEYMVNTIAKANPDKPIYCITLYPFFDDVEVYNEESPKNPEGYRQALRDVVNECEMDNVYLVEGPELLTDFTLLSPDLIHPNDLGMIQMARNLSDVILSNTQ